MNVRPYQAIDKPACVSMCSSNAPAFYLRWHVNEYAAHLDSIEKTLGHQSSCTRVLEEDGIIVASATFKFFPEARCAWINWFMVHAHHHRRGLGWLLLTSVMREISQRLPDTQLIQLQTTQFSVGFYERAGYKITGQRANGFGPDLDQYDMEFTLDSEGRSIVNARWDEEQG